MKTRTAGQTSRTATGSAGLRAIELTGGVEHAVVGLKCGDQYPPAPGARIEKTYATAGRRRSTGNCTSWRRGGCRYGQRDTVNTCSLRLKWSGPWPRHYVRRSRKVCGTYCGKGATSCRRSTPVLRLVESASSGCWVIGIGCPTRRNSVFDAGIASAIGSKEPGGGRGLGA